MVAKTRPGKSRRERGSVVLEMAFIMPVMLLIVAGIVDLGILFWEQEVLTNASREGVRAGARAGINGYPRIRPEDTTNTTGDAVMAIVQSYIDAYNLRDDAGAPINLVKGTNFFYQWDLSKTPADLWVELRNIPVKMMMLPNIGQLFSGTVSNTVYLNARTTMTAEWDNSHPPSP
jgi:hypothetical protein